MLQNRLHAAHVVVLLDLGRLVTDQPLNHRTSGAWWRAVTSYRVSVSRFSSQIRGGVDFFCEGFADALHFGWEFTNASSVSVTFIPIIQIGFRCKPLAAERKLIEQSHKGIAIFCGCARSRETSAKPNTARLLHYSKAKYRRRHIPRIDIRRYAIRRLSRRGQSLGESCFFRGS